MQLCHQKDTYYHDLDIILNYLPRRGAYFRTPVWILPATVHASRGEGKTTVCIYMSFLVRI